MRSAEHERLATPPIPLAHSLAARVFDGYGWCSSRDLEWRRPAGRWDPSTAIDGSNPARMAFVVRPEASARAAFLPREAARLHAFGLGLTDEDALAPWAIDVATDELFARKIEPRDLFWLAADNLNALFWGLHDWAHFHNHGPFEPGQRAWTELQCDAAALVWLWLARSHLGGCDEGGRDDEGRGEEAEVVWERVRLEVVRLSAGRFAGEGLAFEASILSAEGLHAMAARASRS